MAHDLDDIQAMEAKDTSRRLPLGWVILFWGLIVWGIYYAWAYTPPRWSQDAALRQATDAAAGAVASSGTSIFATVFFTAVATIAAVVLLVAVSRKRSGKSG